MDKTRARAPRSVANVIMRERLFNIQRHTTPALSLLFVLLELEQSKFKNFSVLQSLNSIIARSDNR